MSTLLEALLFFLGAPVALGLTWWLLVGRRQGLSAGLRDDLVHR